MIYKIKINNWSNLPENYLADLEGKIPEEIEFSGGTNLIIGPNGCGKSSILNLIRWYTLCKNSEMSKPGKESLWELQSFNGLTLGAEVVADYEKPVFGFLGEIPEGQELKSFENFGRTFISKNSSDGENRWDSLSGFFSNIFSKPISPEIFLRNPNEIPGELEEYYKRNHKPSNKFTIVLDEPDLNLDIDKVQDLVNLLQYERHDVQMIIVLHNPAVIYKLYKTLKNLEVIELEKGYLQKIIKFIEE